MADVLATEPEGGLGRVADVLAVSLWALVQDRVGYRVSRRQPWSPDLESSSSFSCLVAGSAQRRRDEELWKSPPRGL